jgi:hypothetical protein
MVFDERAGSKKAGAESVSPTLPNTEQHSERSETVDDAFDEEVEYLTTRISWSDLRYKFRRCFFNGSLSSPIGAPPVLQFPFYQEGFICELCNVLWIERREGIAFRRACGWVPKYIWEAHATGPLDVKLG